MSPQKLNKPKNMLGLTPTQERDAMIKRRALLEKAQLEFNLSDDVVIANNMNYMAHDLIYAGNYFLGEIKDIWDKWNIHQNPDVEKALNKFLKAYNEYYKTFSKYYPDDKNVVETDGILKNTFISICEDMLGQMNDKALKLQAGVRLRYEKKEGCDTCKKFRNQGCPFSLSQSDHDLKWMEFNYSCLGYSKTNK